MQEDKENIKIYVEKRAPPDFVGYVDVVTLAPVRSPVSRGMRVFNGLVNVQVPKFDNTVGEELTKHLQQLSSVTLPELWTSRQILLTDIFPKLEYAKDLGAIAAALAAPIPAIRHDAAARVERLLLLSNYRALPDAKTTLLSVAQMTKCVLVQDRDEECQIRVYVNLHIMCASALLTKSNPPMSSSESKSFMLTSRDLKQRGGRQDVLKAVTNFYRNYQDHRKELTLPKVDRAKRTEVFVQKHFCEQMAYVFLLFNEASQENWSTRGLDILEELRDLYGALPTAGKYRLSPENRAALDVMVLRCLVLLLTTTFSTEKLEAGRQSYEHAKLAASMAVEVAKACQEHSSRDVDVAAADLGIGSLLFHEATDVKLAMNTAVILSLPSLLPFYGKYLTDSLRVAGLHIEDISSTQECASGQELEVTGRTCGWHRFSGRLGEGQVEGYLLVHTPSCLALEDLTCLKTRRLAGPGHNLETLLRVSPHPHIVQLLAYQINPFPAYVTEQVKGQRLLDHLLSHRAGKRWLDTSTLCRITLDVVTALEFLDSQGMASRDVTTYDMVVVGRRRMGGRAGELIEVLYSEDFTIRLANLAQAHQYRNTDSKDIIPVADHLQGAIPVLWTSPEALMRGEYSWSSMVYAVGCVMYELWTHGCQPFSSLQRSTSDTLRQMLMVEDSVTLVNWQCIPDNVYELIRKCTTSDPSRRPQLKDVGNILKDIIGKETEVKARRRESLMKEDEYPVFSSDQRQRRHVPERGIPMELKEVISHLKAKRYSTTEDVQGAECCVHDDNVMRVTISELRTHEWFQTDHQKRNTTVRENLSPTFTKNILMSLMMCVPPSGTPLPCVTDWTRADLVASDHGADGYVIQVRNYPPSWTLKEAAARGLLTDDGEYISMGPPHFLGVFASTARAVHMLHEQGWLLRDLRASYVLIRKDNHQIILSRIGRMLLLSSSETHVFEEPFEDSKRWLAPEVLESGKYMRANDVFMLGTLFWETLRAREIILKNPSASDSHSVPFASQELETVSSLVKAGTPLPKPATCPDELYDLILSCRLCEASQRPSALQVLDTLDSLMKKLRARQDIRTAPAPGRPLLPPPSLPDVGNYDYVEMEIDTDAESKQDPSDPTVPETDHARILKVSDLKTKEEKQLLTDGLFPKLAKIPKHFKPKKSCMAPGKSTTNLLDEDRGEGGKPTRRDLEKHRFPSMPNLDYDEFA